MKALRWLGAILMVLCGWSAGNLIQHRSAEHIRALEDTLSLLYRIQQEIQYRRMDLEQLYSQLCKEDPRLVNPKGSSLQVITPPEGLTDNERMCFTECLRGLGRTAAEQECERLDYYKTRFCYFLQQARQAEQAQGQLPCKLGIAAGMVLALVFL